ncbi:LysE/ArgO family amino acid transporter [Paracoccus sp. p4-l81]|uniref:LysE/ArgO family amino acid transporter n=1 Tax=Paracoccus sp. p4-l81 TaxID=3342806 RepID=UPI0035B6B53C
MDTGVFLTGMMMGLGLIVAIGAQNAFVLRQGLRGEHVFAVALTCALSDAVLIALGVTSFGKIAAWLPWVEPAMRYGGAAFLIWYGLRSLARALRASDALTVQATGRQSLTSVLATCLALTWLNPHVYLDTVVLLGTISTRFPGQQAAFALGAMAGSFLFFFALAYGARLLRPIFASPRAWRLLEGAIAIVMWTIAARLLIGG